MPVFISVVLHVYPIIYFNQIWHTRFATVVVSSCSFLHTVQGHGLNSVRSYSIFIQEVLKRTNLPTFLKSYVKADRLTPDYRQTQTPR
jgi:hypothetical protein